MKILNLGVSAFCSFIGVLSLSFCVSAATLTEVGKYNGRGEISLNYEVLLREFPDDRPVKALKVVNNNGHLMVSRKGYGDDGTCFTEAVQLVDRCGTPLVLGSDPLMGKRVFLSSEIAVLVRACADDGCHALINVGLPGEQMPISATCDISEISDNKCACHVNRGQGIEIVRDGLLCKSSALFMPFYADEWTNDEAESQGTICQ